MYFVLSPLAQRVLTHMNDVSPGDRVAVAVSGGIDSVALLHLMLEIRGALGLVLSIAHFNHKIRGNAADADQEFVRELAASHRLDFHRGEADTPAYVREHKLSLEAAARALRYDFFRQHVCSGACNKVATAHTLDDQAETVLMRIIRGTGIGGLSAIHPLIRVRDEHSVYVGDIIRPLLEVGRAELETYLRSLHQPWCEDATNADLHHTRNRIRQLVIPLLEREFNPAIRARLAEIAEIARGDQQWWDVVVGELRHDTQRQSVDAMRTMPVAFVRRLIRALAQKHGLALDFQQTEAVRALVKGSCRGPVELGGGWLAELTPTHLHFRAAAELPAPSEYVLRVPAEIGVSELGAVFRVEFAAPVLARDAVFSDRIDASKLDLNQLVLRPWRPGDRFWPQHSSGPKKIKELLTGRHITGAERKLWPVIASGDDIVWLRGFGVAQPFVALEAATDAIVITEAPEAESKSGN